MSRLESMATGNGQTVHEFLTEFLVGRTIKIAAEQLEVGESTLKKEMRRCKLKTQSEQTARFRRKGIESSWAKRKA